MCGQRVDDRRTRIRQRSQILRRSRSPFFDLRPGCLHPRRDCVFVSFKRALQGFLTREAKPSHRVPDASVFVRHPRPALECGGEAIERPEVAGEAVVSRAFHNFAPHACLLRSRELRDPAVPSALQSGDASLPPGDLPFMYRRS